jgi:hypothetical protein
MYEDNYWYESHLNKVVVNDLKQIASLYKVDSWIDIGGNDGTLLSFVKARVKINVDPTHLNKTGFRGYWEEFNGDRVDVITAIACLYDLPNPNKFIKNVKRHLIDSGVFISQFQPLSEMIELNDVGNICHEHIEYYSYKSLVTLYEQNGLEIFKVEVNKMNGGSYRLFARHFKKGSIKFKEKTYGVRELKAFMKRVEKNKKDFLNAVPFKGGLCGYGASTKANTILQYYGIKEMAIIDINPRKKGRYMINSNIEIIDYIPKDCGYLWVFPYGFLPYFKKREKGYKGKWIVTIPEFHVE